MSLTEEFLQKIMEKLGVAPPATKVVPGRFVRFAAEGKTGHNSACWAKLFPDGLGGVFGDWTSGVTYTWQAGITTTDAGRPVREADIQQARLEARDLKYRSQVIAAMEAQRLWDKAYPVESHPYLVAKGIEAQGVRGIGCYLKRDEETGNLIEVSATSELLVVPVYVHGKGLTSLQFINGVGQKWFLPDGEVAGGRFTIGSLKKGGTAIVVEGFATGSTIHQAGCGPVVVAFNCGNLRAVAEVLRQEDPDLEIVLAADNDRFTAGNPGVTKAAEAALAVGGRLAVPVFPETGGPKDTDLNDLARLSGLAAVKACITAAAKPSPASNQKLSRPAEQGPRVWPVPKLFGEVSTPDIPCSLLPSWLGDFVAALAVNTQTPTGMSVMMALAVVAACVQKRFKVARTPEHIEPLVIWTASALPPASRKTAVVNALTGPIATWEKQQSEALKQESERITVVREATEAQIVKLQKRAGDVEDAAERNLLIEKACRLREGMPEPLINPRIFTGDVTPERLQALMMEHNERMAVLSDEGGIFAVMGGLYSGGKANIDVFLKGHAGSAVRVDRQGRTAHLDEPALTFGLCMQPDIIKQLGGTSFRGNGCLARFLFCLPASNIGTRTAQTTPIPAKVKAAYEEGVFSLLKIKPLLDQYGKEQARTITLDGGATEAWNAFFDFIESNMGEGNEFESIQDWAGKLPGAALRIAGIMAVVESGVAAKEITEPVMVNALNLAELLITHAQAAFDLIDGDDAERDAKHVYNWILSTGRATFKRRDAQQEMTRFRRLERLEKALTLLARRGIVSPPEELRSESGRGLPSIVYHVNPLILRQM